MKKSILIFAYLIIQQSFSQDLSQGYIANDLVQHPMQPLAKPSYLQSVTDPSFPSTQIRRITEATPGNFIVPMYNTIQSWNADESLLIVYGGGVHQLLNGQNYTFIRNLTDINPDDLEGVFWSFTDPNVLFYLDNNNDNLYSYNVQTQVKTVIVNIRTVSSCPTSDGLTGGNDIQMMSWDNDVFTFRCGNTAAYYYRISTSTLTQFNIANINYTAPMPFPSGNLFHHRGNVYDANGDFVRALNMDNVAEHKCIGKLSNGDDAIFAIAFEQGPNGDCQGTLVAHNATNGNCFSVTPTSDYGYPKSGTHMSALAHKNNEGGWVAVSSLGYQRDGVQILDQELFIAKVNETDADVYRVAHHRSDEDDIDYWGEPHVTISPTGTRLLFGSDWSGTEDGISIDSYVAELNSFTLSTTNTSTISNSEIKLITNLEAQIVEVFSNIESEIVYEIFNTNGQSIAQSKLNVDNRIDVSTLSSGLYFVKFLSANGTQTLRFIK
ncbi:T9SS type A sorting domain-containing protein [Lacinutrix salivirga]